MPHWLGSADLQKVRNDRFDIIGWTAISEWDDVEPRGSHVGAAIMFSQPLPMEYPSKVNDLIEVLKDVGVEFRSEEHMSELQSLMRHPYAVLCLKKKNKHRIQRYT